MIAYRQVKNIADKNDALQILAYRQVKNIADENDAVIHHPTRSQCGVLTYLFVIYIVIVTNVFGILWLCFSDLV